jgi:hypothetical protein
MKTKTPRILVPIFFVLALIQGPLLLTCHVALLIVRSIYGGLLHLAVRVTWYPKGKRILFVYSNRPLWHDYIVAHILPQIEDRVVILNWS